MKKRYRPYLEGALAIILTALLCDLCLRAAFAQDAPVEDPAPAENPAFALKQRTYLSVESFIPDGGIPKLETRAIDILVKPDHGGLTRDEARAQLRIDARTDVARCLEVIFQYQLEIVTQAKVVATAIANQHPSAPIDPPAEPAQ